MRVGVNCYPLQSSIGGLKQYFVTLFHRLLTCHTNHEFVFFHFPHNAEELSKLGTTAWKAQAVLLRDQTEILQHLETIDLYFCPVGPLWPRPVPKPSLAMLADIQETRYPEFFTAEDLFQRDWHFRGSTRIADLVITISEFSKQAIVEHHRVAAGKVKVIYPAADGRYYRAAAIEVAPKRPFPERFALYPANRWRHKNHHGLLRALRILESQYGLAIPVVFTGYDVPNGYSIADAAAQLGIAHLVHQVGYLHIEEMAYLYRRARCLVLPSLYEGFGIPIVESMAAGCPVLCADHTSLPEIAGQAAVYFDPLDPASIATSLRTAWLDDRLCEGLRTSGFRRALEFSAARMAVEHLSAFEQAVSNFAASRYWQKQLYESYRRRLVHVKRAFRLYDADAPAQ